MSEEATVESGPLEKKIIRQVEFYFGDRNLRRDKFLLEQVKKDDGCIHNCKKSSLHANVSCAMVMVHCAAYCSMQTYCY